MTMKPAEIYLALTERAALLASVPPALPVSLPEPAETFIPPADAPYIEVADFTNDPFWEGIKSGRIDQGILLITLVWPKNRGLLPIKIAAGQVMTHFAKGTVMVSGGTKVRVRLEPRLPSPIHEETEVRQPITVIWAA